MKDIFQLIRSTPVEPSDAEKLAMSWGKTNTLVEIGDTIYITQGTDIIVVRPKEVKILKGAPVNP